MRASQAVADHLLAMPELKTPRAVAVYWAMMSELPLLHAVSALQREGHALYLPMVQDDSSLHFGRWGTGAEMRPNRFGIPEPLPAAADEIQPAHLDIVLVPLLAFDDCGARLGSGAGFYDRSFAFLRDVARPAHPLLVGVAYAFQQVSKLPVEAWDVPLDAIVTEQAMIRFGPAAMAVPARDV
jgi:5-formyltetrahydrofolate cyclo-ligase